VAGVSPWFAALDHEPAEFVADVVVIGSGGAGLCAAAAAGRAGARVILVTKGRAGLANATAYAGGGFTVSPPPGTAGPALSPETHLAMSLETGRHIADRQLLEQLCQRGPAALRELERDFGVRFDWSSSGCSVARYGRPPLLGGVGLTEPLVLHLRQAGVRILEDTVVTGIVPGPHGSMSGVVTLDLGGSRGAPSLATIAAPAVVVATGGGGAIYGRTDNPPRMTGDGYAMLADAGAALRDMEFVQFYPLGIDEPGLPSSLLDIGLVDFVRLVDETGVDPLAGKMAEWGVTSGRAINLVARDRAAVALARHIAAGHRLLLRTDELRERIAGAASDLADEVRSSFPRTFDPFARPVQVAPTQHYFCGGAVISLAAEVLDPDGRTIPGLYACGETTGGVDGANRVGGNALVNIVVFGLSAGVAAARFALARPGRGEGLAAGDCLAPGGGSDRPAWRRAVESLRERLERWTGGRRDEPVRPASLRRDLHRLCDTHLGPVRSEPGLRQALAGLTVLSGHLPRLKCEVPADLLLALEMGFAIRTATFVAKAALLRTESRGSHFREDFPVEGDAWARSVVLGDTGRID
jgi:succinate dehydrogenase/fumarate reductase flavoprotein subunit